MWKAYLKESRRGYDQQILEANREEFRQEQLRRDGGRDTAGAKPLSYKQIKSMTDDEILAAIGN